ncbi:hypothetical protein SRHO_G00257380 [Serrasalmus rhombeus]
MAQHPSRRLLSTCGIAGLEKLESLRAELMTRHLIERHASARSTLRLDGDPDLSSSLKCNEPRLTALQYGASNYALDSDLELDVGERLELDLQISQPVIIMVARPAVLSTVQLCSVDGRQYQCLPEYQPRVLIVRNTFILMDMMPSDSGNYTVQEKDNTPVSISHVTVKGVYNFTLSCIITARTKSL